MFHKLLTLFVCFVLPVAATTSMTSTASANTEPTAYDSRGIGMGLTGTSYLARPSALASNPALLKGVDKFSFQLLINPIFVKTTTPVAGPGSSVSTGIAIGPLGTMFLAGRIAPKVVLGAGFYIEQGYGATFSNVVNVDGAGANTEGEDLTVQQFNGEVAVGTSIELHKNFSIGLALRLPFAIQKADLYQNVGAALGFESYDNVKNELAGVGFPSPRIGLHYKPSKYIEFGTMYRAYSRVKMNGTTETVLLNGGSPVRSTAEWVVPHAVQGGFAVHLLKQKLMLINEVRLQFHDAKKHGNEDQTVIVNDPLAMAIDPVVAPFNWRNVWSIKFGGEYQFSELFALRAGVNIARSNVRKAYAQYFTPPPGLGPAAMGGFGFTWEHFNLDFATLITWAETKIDPSVSAPGQTVVAGDKNPQVCSNEQVIRTGCAGTYNTRSYWLSITLTYKM